MNKELKQRWIKALRSGRYQQGRRALRIKVTSANKSRFEYCCLGVLCNIVDRHWNQSEDTHKHADCNSLLKRSFMLKIGLEEEKQQMLAIMNDNGHNFATIAEWIEKNL